MPELPEVEIVTRALRPHLTKRKIIRIETFTGRLRNVLDIQTHNEILNQKICAVSRRAKYILIELGNLHVILMHLGMSGSCRIEGLGSTRKLHDHVCFYLDNGTIWRFNDPRKFGMMKVLRIEKKGTLPAQMNAYPPEPLSSDFSTSYLFTILKKRKKGIKSVIMDSNLVAGVGNIYANEALFHAGINPTVASHALSKKRTATLIKSIQLVLTKAIKAGGTTISDFKTVDGSEGKFSLQLQVYGKEGENCTRCIKNRILRQVISGRSTFYCPHCQKR